MHTTPNATWPALGVAFVFLAMLCLNAVAFG